MSLHMSSHQERIHKSLSSVEQDNVDLALSGDDSKDTMVVFNRDWVQLLQQNSSSADSDSEPPQGTTS